MIIPSPVGCDEFCESFAIDLSSGSATNSFEHGFFLSTQSIRDQSGERKPWQARPTLVPIAVSEAPDKPQKNSSKMAQSEPN